MSSIMRQVLLLQLIRRVNVSFFYFFLNRCLIWCFFFCFRWTGSSSTCDLVPTLMDIFDAMISGNSNGGAVMDGTLEAPANCASADDQNNRRAECCGVAAPSTPLLQSRHFPVLKIVEPGDRLPANVPSLLRNYRVLSSFCSLHFLRFKVDWHLKNVSTEMKKNNKKWSSLSRISDFVLDFIENWEI